jgi:hypothetical protein
MEIETRSFQTQNKPFVLYESFVHEDGRLEHEERRLPRTRLSRTRLSHTLPSHCLARAASSIGGLRGRVGSDI